MIMSFGSSQQLGMDHVPWKEGEKRINKFCFIGKNLNKDKILKELQECIFDGKLCEPGPVPTTKLQYKLGARVLCKLDKWEKGTIIKLWYREELWETGRYAPYQVELDDGVRVYIPRDENVFVRPLPKGQK